MKHNTVEKKIIDKQASLIKSKKELTDLHISLTQKSFNELQEDIVTQDPKLEEDYKLQPTDDANVFTLKTPAANIKAIITIS